MRSRDGFLIMRVYKEPRLLPAFALYRRFFENLYVYRPEALAGFSLNYAALGTSLRISGKTTPILVPGREQRNLAAQSEGVAGRWARRLFGRRFPSAGISPPRLHWPLATGHPPQAAQAVSRW